MSTLRLLIIFLLGSLGCPTIFGSVYETNSTPCTTLRVVVKQYIFYDGNLTSCPTFEGSVAYGDTLVINDYYLTWWEGENG
jgi:hypothetical protein